jgi:DNA-binding transcriptional MocR family regulator
MTAHRYQEIADLFESRILDGVYRVGDRLPSVREASRSFGVSLTTVYNAYNVLELKGLIRAKPQSGYAVIPSASRTAVGAENAARDLDAPQIDIETIALKIIAADNLKSVIPFGSVFVDADLFPVSRLLKIMRYASHKFEDSTFRLHSVAGLVELRREIAKRYTRQGYSVSSDEIIVTSGSIDSINIALAALLKPGDSIALEDPCFYPTIFSARRLGLRTVPIPVSPQSGIDLDYLESILARGGIKAVVVMTSCHMPMGVNLSAEKQQRLVRLVEKYDIPLIENGAYNELKEPEEGPASCKIYETSGLVINCSSFSSSLSPQLRVGWVAAGRFRSRILSVKFLTSMTSHWIAQRTALEFLRNENLDRHMRTIRQALERRMAIGLRELDKWPYIIKQHSSPKGGAMVWIELSDEIDTLRLFAVAASQGISFMPGALFSVGRLRQNELAMNFSFPWTNEALTKLRSLRSIIEDYEKK